MIFYNCDELENKLYKAGNKIVNNTKTNFDGLAKSS